eukprot:gb/GECG01006686.1/.p1 GENE.gb/GECG01006686.1/~~gb/GECG01006686.1/.p1  ORF type:complete len:491 (+),score=50.24 gb/GECG01006686.1/:1-1473(+)
MSAVLGRLRSRTWFGTGTRRPSEDCAAGSSPEPSTARVRKAHSFSECLSIGEQEADSYRINDTYKDTDIRINSSKVVVSSEPEDYHYDSEQDVGVKVDPYGFKFHGTNEQLEEMYRKKAECTNIWETAFPSGSVPDTTCISEIFLFATHYGIAEAFRPQLWMQLSGAAALQESMPNNFYSSLVNKSSKDLPETTSQQIELDIPRTFGDHVWFTKKNFGAQASDEPNAGGETGEATILCRLRRVLNAFALLNPHVGYVQSMNFIAGFALVALTLGNRKASGINTDITDSSSTGTFKEDDLAEEQSFWLLHVLVTRLFPGFYCHGLGSVRVASRVFEDFFEEQQPQLKEVIQNAGFGITLVLPRWYLCLFLNCYSASVTLHIWDVIFCNAAECVPGQSTLGDASTRHCNALGPKNSENQSIHQSLCCRSIRLLVQLALASLKIYEERFLNSPSNLDVVDEIQKLGADLSDSVDLVNTTLRSGCFIDEKKISS